MDNSLKLFVPSLKIFRKCAQVGHVACANNVTLLKSTFEEIADSSNIHVDVNFKLWKIRPNRSCIGNELFVVRGSHMALESSACFNITLLHSKNASSF